MWSLPLSLPASPSSWVLAEAGNRYNVDAVKRSDDPFALDIDDVFEPVPLSDSCSMMDTTQGLLGLQAPTATTVPPRSSSTFPTTATMRLTANKQGNYACGAAAATTPSKTAPDNNDSSKPKRPLTAYNIFFKFQRQQILAVMPVRATGKPRKSHGKMGFADMARAIAGKWKTIQTHEKAIFVELATAEKKRYKQEMEEWKIKSNDNSLKTNDSHAALCVMRTNTTEEPDNGETTTPPPLPQDPNHHLALMQSLGLANIEYPQESSRMVPFLQMNIHEKPLLANEPMSLLELSYQSFLSRGSNQLGPHAAHATTTPRSLISSPQYYHGAAAHQQHDDAVDDHGGFATLAARLGSDGCDLLLEIFSQEQ
jgi:HMG-box domain